MAAPGFYDDRTASKELIDRHQTLMWEVGDLIGQWEALQEHAASQTSVAADDLSKLWWSKRFALSDLVAIDPSGSAHRPQHRGKRQRHLKRRRQGQSAS